MRSIAWAGMALVAGCQWAVAAPAVSAVIVDSTETGQAELRQVVSSALGGPPVLLAADALVHSSELLIERTPRSGPQGVRIPGRDMEPVQRFRLVVSDGQCLLVHVNTDTRYELRQIKCRPATSKESGHSHTVRHRDSFALVVYTPSAAMSLQPLLATPERTKTSYTRFAGPISRLFDRRH